MEYQRILILTAILLFSLTFPPLNIGLMAYISWVPLYFYLNQNLSTKKILISGLLYGSSITAIYTRWFISLNEWAPIYSIIILWTILIIYSGIFYSGLFFIIKLLKSKIGLFNSSIIGIVITEWIKQLGPFGIPIGILGYSQAYYPSILNIASIFGVIGISLFIISINYIIFSIAEKKPMHHSLALSILFIIIISFKAINNEPDKTEIMVSIVQPNHSQHEKLNPYTNKTLTQKLLIQSQKLLQKSSLIVWPETVSFKQHSQDKSFLKKVRNSLNSKNLLLGTPEIKEQELFNSALLVSKTNTQIYTKKRLMPFGEYFPFKKILILLKLDHLIPNREFSSENQRTLLISDPLKIATGICLEAIYQSEYLDQSPDSNLLVLLSNSAWFFDSIAAQELFELSILRAVENNRYLVHAANTGISGIINHKGHIISQTKLNKKAELTATVQLIDQPSIFSKIGNYGVFSLAALIAILGFKSESQSSSS